MLHKSPLSKGKSDWKHLVESLALEDSMKSKPATDRIAKTWDDKFFHCLQLLAPVLENIKAYDRKIPTMQDGSTFLRSKDLTEVYAIIEKLAKHYQQSPTVSFKFTKTYVDKIVAMLDQYVDIMKDKEQISDILDKLLVELYHTVYTIRKELRYA